MTHTGGMSNCTPSCGPLPQACPLTCFRFDDFKAFLTFEGMTPEGDSFPLDMSHYTDFHACIYAKHPQNELGEFHIDYVDTVKGKIAVSLASDCDFFANYPAATYMWQMSARDESGLKTTYISASPFEVRTNE